MIKILDNGVIINIKLFPNSSKNDILMEEDIVKMHVSAQPIENKANKALINSLSKFLKVPKSYIKIIRGDTSKEKVIFIECDINKAEQIVTILLQNKKVNNV